MGFSLKGFATGMATAAGEVMDEERKQTNNLIAQRTKNSFENYTKYQETTEALRSDIKKRDTMLVNWQPDLTDQERIAAAGIPNLVDMYQRLVADGKQVSVRDMIKVSEKSAGMKFDNYVTELGKIAPAQGAAAPVTATFLGPSEESQRKMAEKTATATGVPEAELRSFQTMPRTADVSSMGSLNVDVFKKAPKEAATVEEFLEAARLARMKAEAAKGKNSPEYKEADAAFKLATSNLDKPKETITARKDRLIQDKIDYPARAKDIDVELRKIYKELQIADRLSKDQTKEQKEDTYGQLKRITDDYVNTRMRKMVGTSWYQMTTFASQPLPDGTVYVDRTEKVDMTPEQRADQFKVVEQLTREALKSNGYLTPTGAPIYNSVARYMNNVGVVGQAAPESATPVVAPAAAPATATPVATPASARPNAPPTTSVDKLRNEANAAIKLGADKTQTAERFKKATGQEL